MSNALTAGVAGAGVFGGYHAQKYAELDGVTLVSVFDVDPHKAKALAVRHEVSVAACIDAMLSDIDVLTIATPAGTHYDLAMKAIQAGIAVYVEKPLSDDLGDATALVTAAEKAGVILACGHQERAVFEPLLPPDALNDFDRIEFARVGPASGRCEDVSVVLDLMVHDIDLAIMAGLGAPTSINAVGDAHEVVATIAFDTGKVASFIASRRANTPRRAVSIKNSHTETVIDFMKRRTEIDDKPWTQAGEIPDDPLLFSVKRFVEAVQGLGKPLANGREGRDALELALAIERERCSLTRAGIMENGLTA